MDYKKKHFPITIKAFAYLERDQSYYINPHTSDVSHWYCVNHGRVKMTIDGISFTLGPEECILIPPGAVREIQCFGKSPGYTFVLFKNFELEIASMFNKKFQVPTNLRDDLNLLIKEAKNFQEHSNYLVPSVLIKILLHLSRLGENRLHKNNPSHLNEKYQAEMISRVDDYIMQNIDQPVSRKELSDFVNLSVSRLSKIYKNLTGLTLLDKITETKMIRAKELLLDSTLPISQISIEVGYPSFSHFSSTFKKKFRVSPSVYRQSLGESGDHAEKVHYPNTQK